MRGMSYHIEAPSISLFLVFPIDVINKGVHAYEANASVGDAKV